MELRFTMGQNETPFLTVHLIKVRWIREHFFFLKEKDQDKLHEIVKKSSDQVITKDSEQWIDSIYNSLKQAHGKRIIREGAEA